MKKLTGEQHKRLQELSLVLHTRWCFQSGMTYARFYSALGNELPDYEQTGLRPLSKALHHRGDYLHLTEWVDIVAYPPDHGNLYAEMPLRWGAAIDLKFADLMDEILFE